MNSNSISNSDVEPLWVDLQDAGKRLDVWLSERHADLSRTYFQRLVDEGLVLVNGAVQRKRYLVNVGDEVEVEFRAPPAMHLIAQDLPLDIIYEDEAILVINKAAGMVVHPGAGCHQGTVANALAYRCGLVENSDLRPGIVHRLDKDTTGLLITAKKPLVHAKLVEQFASRSVQKTYLAICCKNAPPLQVDLPIGRDPHNRQRMQIVEGARAATTRFDLIAAKEEPWALNLLRVQLLTGRTHQIRVHLKASQCPILGDSIYGWEGWNSHYGAQRQLLHAWKLALYHPLDGRLMEWTAPLPPDMLTQVRSMVSPAQWERLAL